LFETIVVNPIFNALMLIYSAVPGGDFGVALIIFTIIVRLLMYPLVKNQLHQTKAMRKLQPELAKIKKNAQGNKQIEALQQMELYKRYGIKPLRSILILIIQLPIIMSWRHSRRRIITVIALIWVGYLYRSADNCLDRRSLASQILTTTLWGYIKSRC
jgi:membrane protein insertase Oxa1/YidC/SpoIIIJ